MKKSEKKKITQTQFIPPPPKPTPKPTQENKDHAKVAKRIEADKKMFVGQEISGKTLGVIGLGAIGARGVEAALGLGMKVVGVDPALSLEAAIALPGKEVDVVQTLEEVVKVADYVTLHVPYMVRWGF